MFCDILLFFIINRTLVALSLLSGIIMVLLNIFWYALILWIYPNAIADIWYLQNLTGFSLWGVPMEEHLYIFLLGCLGSLTYKIITGTKNRQQSLPAPNPTGIRFRTLLLPALLLLLTIAFIAIFGEKGRLIREKSFRSANGSIRQAGLLAKQPDRPPPSS